MVQYERSRELNSGRADPVVAAARKRLEQSDAFRGRTDEIEIDRQDRCLVVHGKVPSFYLKQILQSALRDIEGIDVIDNQVDVVWPDQT